MSKNLNDILSHVQFMAVSAACKASEAILKIYTSGNFQTERKSDDSPLTIADKTAHSIIADMLSASGFPVLSEEGKETAFEQRYKWEDYWLVDPLDGTKEFLKQNGEFTVNIAWMHASIPFFGVIAVPVEGTVFFGPVDGIVYCQTKEGSLKILNAGNSSGVKSENKAVRVVASRSHRDPLTEDFISSLEDPVLVSRGSSLKFLLLAEGLADVYPRFAPTMEWDTAAADAILRPLNISIRRIDDGKFLEYNKRDLRNPFFICRPENQHKLNRSC